MAPDCVMRRVRVGAPGAVTLRVALRAPVESLGRQATCTMRLLLPLLLSTLIQAASSVIDQFVLELMDILAPPPELLNERESGSTNSTAGTPNWATWMRRSLRPGLDSRMVASLALVVLLGRQLITTESLWVPVLLFRLIQSADSVSVQGTLAEMETCALPPEVWKESESGATLNTGAAPNCVSTISCSGTSPPYSVRIVLRGFVLVFCV